MKYNKENIPSRVAATASKLLKHRCISAKRQQNLQNNIFKYKIVVVIGRCQLLAKKRRRKFEEVVVNHSRHHRRCDAFFASWQKIGT